MQARRCCSLLLASMMAVFTVSVGAQAPTGQVPTGPTDKKGGDATTQPGAPQPFAPPAGGENQQFYEIKVGANQTKIDPDVRDEYGNPARSFLTPGWNVTTDFSLFQDHTFGTTRLQVLGIFRNNNDPRVDPESNSLQRGYLRMTTPNWELNVGDALIGYSRLTYSQNTKGLSVTRKFGKGFRLMANAGVFTDRWGSIWKTGLQGKPFTRAVAGLRAEERIGADKVIGFNFSHGRDLPTSIRPDLLQQFALVPQDNQVVSVDARLTFYRVFTVEGEFAYSQTNIDARIAQDKRKDYGGRLDTNLRWKRFFLRTNYVRLMPSFLAINARQLADLQDANVRAGVDLSNSVTLEGSYRYTNNNLRKNRPEGTAVFRMPEARMSFRNIAGLGKTIFDVGYRERQQIGPIRTVDPMKGAKENKRTPIPFAEVAVPIGNSLISVAYEHRINNNSTLPSEKTAADSYSGSLRSNFGLGRWTFAPMFRYQMEREDFFRVFEFNTNRSMLASAFIDAPKWFSFEATYRQVGASLFAECVETTGTSCNPTMPVVPSTTVLLPAGFRRPAFHAAITYKFFNSEDRFLVIAFDRNHNFFALPGRDFNERVISATLVARLRR